MGAGRLASMVFLAVVIVSLLNYFSTSDANEIQDKDWDPFLRAMRKRCAPIYEGLLNRDSVASPYLGETYALNARVVCILPSGTFLHDGRHERSLIQGRGVTADPLHFDGLAGTYYPLHRGVESPLVMHESMAMVMASRDNYHLFHFLCDGVIGAMSTILNTDNLKATPRSAVFIEDFLVSKLPVSWPTSWNIVKEWTSVLGSNISDAPLIYTRDITNNVTHCFCGSLIAHASKYRRRVQYMKQTARAGDPGFEALHAVRVLLMERYQLPRYGSPSDLGIAQRAGLWKTAVEGRPLLLLHTRSNREINDIRSVVLAAEVVGFSVEVMDSANVSPRLHVIAARFADVFLAVHGAELSYVFLMESDGVNICRSVIELNAWVRHGDVPFFQIEANMASLSYTLVQPYGVVFRDRSLRKPSKLSFDNLRRSQLLSYDINKIKAALSAAHKRWSVCASKELRAG